MTPTRKGPLFILSGASGVGKSAAAELLFQTESDYIVMESDLLWCDAFNTPKDNYRSYRELWLNVCASIAQIGKPVLLCGCAMPEQFECCAARELFTELHYIAVTTRPEMLEQRMRAGRGISDAAWLESSAHFNNWLIANGADTQPAITIIDASDISIAQTAAQIDAFVRQRLR